MIKALATLALCVALGGACESGSGAWTYRSDFDGATWPQFVSSNDAVLIYETKFSPYRTRLRFFSGDGEMLADVEPTQRGVRQEYHFVLVDGLHVIHPVSDERRIELLPETSSPSPVARAFLTWAHAAGGIAHNTYLHASTNPYADLSCAVGADGSLAVWRTVGAVQFEASAPGTISLSATSVHNIYCLETPGGSPLQASIAPTIEAHGSACTTLLAH